MEARAPKAVFLSYASQDADAARRIADALRAFGIEVWFDQSELRGGDTWDATIKRQIRECALFLPIISQQTQHRMEGYFRREWLLAVERTRDMAQGVAFIVPVVIDEIRENEAAAPEEFMRYQWTRLPHGVPSPQFVEHVKRLLVSPYNPVAARNSEVGDPTPVHAGQGRRAFPTWARLVAAAVAVVAVALVVVLWRSSSPPPSSAAQAGRGASTVASGQSVAVLPFVNLGADKSDEYLSDGMTEELLNALSKVKGLRVPGRTSCFAYKGKTEEGIFRKVGEQLGVSTVLEGSVRKIGDKLRITAQLINVADGFHLWSDTYDRGLADILTIQTEVAQQVAAALKLQLGVADSRRVQAKPTENPVAYELYLKGRFHERNRYSEQTSRQAIEFFQQAIALDSAFSKAYAGLAATYAWVSSVYLPPKEAMPLAKSNILKALELDDSSAEAHHSYATIKYWGDWDFPGAEREFKRSLELNPNESQVYCDYGMLLRDLKRWDEAHEILQKAAQLSPSDSAMYLSWLYESRGQHGQAVAFALQAAQYHPGSALAQTTVASTQLEHGKQQEAIDAARKALDLAAVGDRGVSLTQCAAILARAGRPDEARKHLEEINQLRRERYLSPVYLATLYEALGDREAAVGLLHTALEDRCDHLLWIATTVWLEPLCRDPRVKEILRKVGVEK